MTPSPPYTVGCFRGGHGLGVAKGRALRQKCPSFSSPAATETIVVDDLTPTHDATHHTHTNMCAMAATSILAVQSATNSGTESSLSTSMASTTRTIVHVNVTVALKSTGHPRHPKYVSTATSTHAYYLDGVEAASYHVQRGKTYRFQTDEATWLAHPFQLYLDDSHGIYNGGDVTYTTPSSTNNYVFLELRVDGLSPRTASANPVNPEETLAYACSNHVGMGGRMSFHSANVNVIDVDVRTKTLSNPYHPSGMPNASPLSFYFDGVEASSFMLSRGTTYVFDQTNHVSNQGHPLRFYHTNDRVLLYGHKEDVRYPSTGINVVGITRLIVGDLTPRTYAPGTPSSLSYQASNSNRMGGIATIVDPIIITGTTAATVDSSSASTTASASATVALSANALVAAFASAPPSIGSPATAVKQDLNICKAYMGIHMNTCLCYEANPSGTSDIRTGVASSSPSSSASIRLCAAECSSEKINDGFKGTDSDGYDGSVEVLGWSCFTTVPSNIPAESVSSLPDASVENNVLGTSASAVVEAAVAESSGGLVGVNVNRLSQATSYGYNATHAYGGTRYVIDGVVSPSLTLMLGGVYIFLPLSTIDGIVHPLRLSTNSDGTHMEGGTMYKDATTVHMGTDNTTLILSVTCDVPKTLYYYCPTHKGMGNMMVLSRPGESLGGTSSVPSTSSTATPATSTPATAQSQSRTTTKWRTGMLAGSLVLWRARATSATS